MAQAGRKGIAAFIALFFAAGAAHACPGCADIVTKGKEALANFRFFQGVNWSVLFMLSVPYVLMGSGVFLIWRSARKAKKAANESS